MKIRLLVAALILSAGINIGVLVGLLCRRRAERPTAVSGCVMERSYLNRRLGLSSGQLDRVSAMRDSMVQRSLPLRNDLCAKRAELLSHLSRPETDSAGLDSLVREIAGLQAEMEFQVFQNARRIRAALTPEQQERFVEIFGHQLCGGGLHTGSVEDGMNCNPSGK